MIGGVEVLRINCISNYHILNSVADVLYLFGCCSENYPLGCGYEDRVGIYSSGTVGIGYLAACLGSKH